MQLPGDDLHCPSSRPFPTLTLSHAKESNAEGGRATPWKEPGPLRLEQTEVPFQLILT